MELPENDRFIYTVQKLRPERPPEFRRHRAFHRSKARVGAFPCLRCKAERRTRRRDALCTHVRRHDDRCVAKVHLPSLRIRHRSVLQDLQQQVPHVLVRLFDLVEKHNAVRLSPHLFRQLPAFVVADVTRRRADQARNAVLFHILAHVDADHCLLAAEHRLGERAAQLCFAHARRPEEEKRPDRPPRIFDADSTPTDGARHSAHRLVLPHNARMKRRLQRQQSCALALIQPRDGNARPVREHRRNVLRRHANFHVFGFADLLFPLRCRLRAKALLRIAQARCLFVILRADGRFLFPCSRGSPLFHLPQRGGGAARAHAHARRRLIDKVDGLIRQKAVRQIALGKRHRRRKRAVLDRKAVVCFIFRPQGTQNDKRFFLVRFAHLHALEAPLERSVLFDEFTVLRKRCRADDADLSAPEGGL